MEPDGTPPIFTGPDTLDCDDGSHAAADDEGPALPARSADSQTCAAELPIAQSRPIFESSGTVQTRDNWSGARSVSSTLGTSMRGWASIVSTVAMGTVQGAMQEVQRNSTLFAAQMNDGLNRGSSAEQLNSATDRARNLGGRMAERVGIAGGELNEALQFFDTARAAPCMRARSSSTLSSSLGSLREEAQPILHELKYAPLGAVEAVRDEAPVADDTRLQRANVSKMARKCWELWRRKHEALTASEGLYASLLADSRRVAVLTAELTAVQAFLEDESSPAKTSDASATEQSVALDLAQNAGQLRAVETARQEALDACRKAVASQAKEAVDAYRERLDSYPCGRASVTTKLLRIARSADEVQEVLRAFELRVAEETSEALSQSMEIALTPDLQILSLTLSRRVEFWEGEIEENWSMWTAQATIFHEACEGVAETWTSLYNGTLELLQWAGMEGNEPSSATPPIAFLVPLLDVEDVQRHRIWEELYQVFIEVAVSIAKLGAWTHHHNLRGDGETLLQAEHLFTAILSGLDCFFDARYNKFRGREDVLERLANDEAWNLVGYADDLPSAEASVAWWGPRHWPARKLPQAASPAFAGKTEWQADGPDQRLTKVRSRTVHGAKLRDCYDMLWASRHETNPAAEALLVVAESSVAEGQSTSESVHEAQDGTSLLEEFPDDLGAGHCLDSVVAVVGASDSTGDQVTAKDKDAEGGEAVIGRAACAAAEASVT